jgi:TPR repeat protein
MLPRRLFSPVWVISASLLLAAVGNASPIDEVNVALRSGEFVRAVALLRPLADQGDAVAQRRLAQLLTSGQGIEKDSAEARRLFERSASQDDAEAQFLLAGLYLQDAESQPTLLPLGTAWLQKAAQQGFAPAQAKLGFSYEQGKGVPKDMSQALDLYRKAAERGDPWAQLALARCAYFGKGVPQNYEDAARWLRLAAEQDLTAAVSWLADLYHQGKGVPIDAAKARQLYRKAARLGDAGAQFSLALVYRFGDGVPQDDFEAAYWMRKAADQGHPLAQRNLAVAYQEGSGVEQDMELAIKWYRLSADQGDAMAQNNLGSIYHSGMGGGGHLPKSVIWYRNAFDLERKLTVAQDYQEARKWFLRSAQQKNYVAMLNLGVIYANAQGVQKDLVEASKWYTLALSNLPTSGDVQLESRIVALRNLAETQMTPQEINDGRNRATKWQPNSAK